MFANTLRHSAIEMADTAIKLDLKNFIEFVQMQNEEFCRLDRAVIEKYLCDDNLLVKDEKEAFDALQQWVLHSPTERFADVPKLLSLIRLNQLESDFLKTTVKQFALEGNCAELIESAIERQSRPLHQRDDVTVDFCTKPRKSAIEISIVAICMEETPMLEFFSTTVKKYSTKTKEWVDLSNANATLGGFHLANGTCAMHGKHNLIVYVKKMHQILSINLVTMEADPLPAQLRKIYSSTMEVVDDKLYMFGSDVGSLYNITDLLFSTRTIQDANDLKNLRSAAQRFNFKTRTWSSIQPMTIPRQGQCSAVLDGKIYTAGGSPKSAAEYFDTKTGRWNLLPSTLRKRINATMVSSDKYLYLFGGRGYSDDGHGPGAFKSVERYDPVNNEWTIIAELNDFLYGFTAISIFDRVHLIGGEDVSNISLGYIVDKVCKKSKASKPYPIFDLNTEKFTDDTIAVMPDNILWPFVGYYINE